MGSIDVDEGLSAGLDLGPIVSIREEIREEAFAVVAVRAAHDSSFSFR
jgi:hypothetical protein